MSSSVVPESAAEFLAVPSFAIPKPSPSGRGASRTGCSSRTACDSAAIGPAAVGCVGCVSSSSGASERTGCSACGCDALGPGAISDPPSTGVSSAAARSPSDDARAAWSSEVCRASDIIGSECPAGLGAAAGRMGVVSLGVSSAGACGCRWCKC
eukprot:329784-Prorocentrum_minimum.AAC.4